jgi:hypothetical protein
MIEEEPAYKMMMFIVKIRQWEKVKHAAPQNISD